MRNAPLPLDAHAGIEPFAALLLIAAPWIFGFSSVDAAVTVSIVLGIAMLLSGAMTRWRYSLVHVIPLRVHFMGDLLIGLLLILSPFVFGYSDNGAATRFDIIFGALEILTALSTRWDWGLDSVTEPRMA